MPTGEESARRITHAPQDLERRRRGNQGQYDRSPRWQDHRRPNRNGGPLHPDAGLETSLIVSASHLVHEMIEARDEKRLLRHQDQLARVSLLIVDELGYVPLSQTGSELLFDVFSRRYENGPPSSPQTCPSKNGQRCSPASASRAPYSTASHTTSTSWK